MRLSRMYNSSELGGSAPEPETEQDLYTEDEYRHINREGDTPLAYFIKFIAVISLVLLTYMFMTGKL